MDKQPRPAYVVDYDEEQQRPVKGTRRTAREKPREKPKVLRSKTAGVIEYSADRAVKAPAERKNVEIITEREVKSDRRKSSSATLQSPRKNERPPSAHRNKSFQKIDSIHKPERPEHFGLPPTSTRPSISPIVSQPSPQQAQQAQQVQHHSMPQPIPVRPRTGSLQAYNPRPPSFQPVYNAAGGYGGGPPLSQSAWAHYQPPAPSPSPYQMSSGYARQPPAPAPPPAADYFEMYAMSAPERPSSARPLSSRFEAPPSRTSSGFGIRDSIRDTSSQSAYSTYDAGYYDEGGYALQSEGKTRRRESIRVPSKAPSRLSTPSKLSKAEVDYHAMPPPSRPSILRRPLTDYPHASDPMDSYHEPVISYRETGRTLIRDDSRAARRTSSRRNSVQYDRDPDTSRSRGPRSHRSPGNYDDIISGMERIRIETANNGRRRHSYYGQPAESAHTTSTASSGMEEKMRNAANYQQGLAGPSMPLTADTLKKQQRRQTGSSRSTKSSASRDESDWRKSNTTRTTQSGSGGDGENVTIKVTGTARVRVHGAEIECPDGGEIEIKRQPSLRNGSERSGSEYSGPVQAQIDDRRSRIEKPSSRSRMDSQHSYTRSTQCYGDGYF